MTIETWTEEKLVDELRDVRLSFTADDCGGCRKTANVRQGPWIPGWKCGNCGAWNTSDWSGNSRIPHNAPDMGPTAAQIQAAIAKARA